jgi:hypothetical protein
MRRSPLPFALPGILGSALLLVACAAAPSGGGGASIPDPATARVRLESHRWELVYWEGRTVPHGDNGEPVILSFKDGRVSGHAGCNRMNAGFELGPEPGALRVSQGMLTPSTRYQFDGDRHRLSQSASLPALEFHKRELQGE